MIINEDNKTTVGEVIDHLGEVIESSDFDPAEVIRVNVVVSYSADAKRVMTSTIVDTVEEVYNQLGEMFPGNAVVIELDRKPKNPSVAEIVESLVADGSIDTELFEVSNVSSNMVQVRRFGSEYALRAYNYRAGDTSEVIGYQNHEMLNRRQSAHNRLADDDEIIGYNVDSNVKLSEDGEVYVSQYTSKLTEERFVVEAIDRFVNPEKYKFVIDSEEEEERDTEG